MLMYLRTGTTRKLRATAMLVALAAFSLTSPATARQVCLPGEGLDCGPSAPSVQVPSRGGYSGGGGAGAAAAGVGAALGIFSAIFDLIESSRESSDESVREAEDARNAQLARNAAAMNDQGLRAYNAGDFDGAIADFVRASEYASNLRPQNFELIHAYSRNSELARARKMLDGAEALYRAGRYNEASRQYLLAAQAADWVKASDIAAMVRAHHQQMMAALSNAPASARQGVLDTNSVCHVVNGETLCEQPAAASRVAVAAPPPARTQSAGASRPGSATGASALAPHLRWMNDPTPANCDAALPLDKTTAGWYDACVPRGGAGGPNANLPGGAQQPGAAPANHNPSAGTPGAQAGADPALPAIQPATLKPDDDGRECGQYYGRRARGQCFAPWDGYTKEACELVQGGTFYPRSGRSPAFCAYDAPANPETAHDGPADGASCGDAGGHMHAGRCWVVGITRSDCQDQLHGQTVDSAGYQYCVYNTAAQGPAKPGAAKKAGQAAAAAAPQP
jgi:hypothetical protein